jgi:vitamin B12 transporter
MRMAPRTEELCHEYPPTREGHGRGHREQDCKRGKIEQHSARCGPHQSCQLRRPVPPRGRSPMKRRIGFLEHDLIQQRVGGRWYDPLDPIQNDSGRERETEGQREKREGEEQHPAGKSPSRSLSLRHLSPDQYDNRREPLDDAEEKADSLDRKSVNSQEVQVEEGQHESGSHHPEEHPEDKKPHAWRHREEPLPHGTGATADSDRFGQLGLRRTNLFMGGPRAAPDPRDDPEQAPTQEGEHRPGDQSDPQAADGSHARQVRHQFGHLTRREYPHGAKAQKEPDIPGEGSRPDPGPGNGHQYGALSHPPRCGAGAGHDRGRVERGDGLGHRTPRESQCGEQRRPEVGRPTAPPVQRHARGRQCHDPACGQRRSGHAHDAFPEPQGVEVEIVEERVGEQARAKENVGPQEGRHGPPPTPAGTTLHRLSQTLGSPTRARRIRGSDAIGKADRPFGSGPTRTPNNVMMNRTALVQSDSALARSVHPPVVLRRGLRELVTTFAAMVAVALGTPAVAQQSDTTGVPDTVFAADPVVVTASRLPTGAEALGVAVGRVQLRPSRPAFAADWLDGVQGSFIDQAAGPGGPTIVRLRGGEEVFTQILFDGVQVNQNGGFFDFQGLALSNVAQVDIARGPQSSVYGSSAVSGVVQFHTPRGVPGPPEATLRVEGGDAVDAGGSWTATGSVRGGSERFQYSAGAGAAFNRGIYSLPHDTRTRDVSFRLDVAPADQWEATFVGRRVDMESLLPVRDPGATRVPLDPNASNERNRTVASLMLRHTPDGPWSGWFRTYRYDESFLYHDERDDVMLPEDAGFFVFDANLDFTSDLMRTGVEVGVTLDARPVQATLGALWELEDLEDRITGDFASDPVLLDRSAIAGFGEVAWWARPDLTVGAGVRVEKFEGIAAEATPRVSVVWAADDAIKLRAVAGRAYKAPNLQQQYVDNPFIEANPELRPESSTSVEVGVDVAPPSSGVRAGLTLFRQRYEDLIRTVGQDDDDRQINRNLGESESLGIEWTAAAHLAGPWWLESQGAWLRTKILDNAGLSGSEFPKGEELPFRPAVVGSLSLAYQGRVAEGRLSARHVGAQTVLSERFSGERVDLDAYTLVRVTGSYRMVDGADLFVRLENLFDTDYLTAFDRRGIPATGAIGVEVRF